MTGLRVCRLVFLKPVVEEEVVVVQLTIGSKAVVRKDVFPLTEPFARSLVRAIDRATWLDFGIARLGALVKLLNNYTCRRVRVRAPGQNLQGVYVDFVEVRDSRGQGAMFEWVS